MSETEFVDAAESALGDATQAIVYSQDPETLTHAREFEAKVDSQPDLGGSGTTPTRRCTKTSRSLT